MRSACLTSKKLVKGLHVARYALKLSLKTGSAQSEASLQVILAQLLLSRSNPCSDISQQQAPFPLHLFSFTNLQGRVASSLFGDNGKHNKGQLALSNRAKPMLQCQCRVLGMNPSVPTRHTPLRNRRILDNDNYSSNER